MAAADRRGSCSPPPTTSSPPDAAATASSAYFPPELIPHIASRLTSLQDFFALRAACRAYRALLPPTASNLACQAPLLLVPHLASESHALFHLPLRRLHRFRLPNRLTADVHSLPRFHSLGCRLTFYGRGHDDFRIVHLLTGEQACLPNPPQNFANILLAGDLVLTWNYMARNIQYCRLGAAVWHVASMGEEYFLEDMVSVNGTLYALVTGSQDLAETYRLAIVNLSDSGDSVELALLGGNLDTRDVCLPEGSDLYLCLAVCRGELLLLNAVGFNPRAYDVFRWKAEEAKWMKISSLGGCTLFFEGFYFMGCLGPDHPGIRGDCLYFTERDGRWAEYSLVDKSFREFAAVDPNLVEPIIWVFPNMC
ncbi:hypothetical protein ACP70R_001314 [Stipagrostis hirtigluma subsp. patula]